MCCKPIIPKYVFLSAGIALVALIALAIALGYETLSVYDKDGIRVHWRSEDVKLWIDDESTFFGNDTINGTITYNYVETCEAIGTGSDICTIESLGGQWRSMTIVSFLCGCFAFAFLTIHGITHIHKVHAYCCSCGVCNVLDQCCSCFLTSSVYFGLAFGGVMAGFGVFVWQFKNPVYKASSEIDYQPGVSIYLAGAAGALLLIACCLALPQRSTDESKVTDDKVGYSSQPSTGSYIETTNKV